jgi:hypothetical protein
MGSAARMNTENPMLSASYSQTFMAVTIPENINLQGGMVYFGSGFQRFQLAKLLWAYHGSL